MEEKIFPRPAVAGALKAGFIEARLHTDGTGEAKYDYDRELQKKYTNSFANPIYVIVDPKTGEKVRKKAGYMSEAKFLEFLSGAPAQ
jgi:thioredoxin-related protein